MCLVYTDGSCIPNPGNGGFAVVFINCKSKIVSHIKKSQQDSTNNRMELLAVHYALSAISNLSCKCTIYCDSSYIVSGINNWMYNWEKHNWTRNKKPLAHSDLWQEIYHYQLAKKVICVWVKAHAGNYYNEMADKLATAAATTKKDKA